jgi:hypothetical protein
MLIVPECFKRRCIHLLGAEKSDPEDEETEYLVCEAFPGGIPDEIAYGDNLHLTPLPGQENSIVYERED